MSRPLGYPSLISVSTPDGTVVLNWVDSVGGADILGGYVNNDYNWVSGNDGPGLDSFCLLPPGGNAEEPPVISASGTYWVLGGWGDRGRNILAASYVWGLAGLFLIPGTTSVVGAWTGFSADGFVSAPIAQLVLPLGVTVGTQPNPEFNLYAMQGEERAFEFALVDANDNPLTLSSDTISFAAYSDNGVSQALVFSYTGSPNIVVTTGNVVAVTLQSTDTATSQVLKYSLWDDSSDLVLSHGLLNIAPTIKV
jgi:hypothetical protein